MNGLQDGHLAYHETRVLKEDSNDLLLQKQTFWKMCKLPGEEGESPATGSDKIELRKKKGRNCLNKRSI